MRQRLSGRIALLSGLLFALFFFGGMATGNAQTAATLQNLTVTLLPQYDDPRLMIVVEAELSAAGQGAVAVPTHVELAAAEARREDGTYEEISVVWEGAPDGRYITFTSSTPHVRLTLYRDSLPDTPRREAAFDLPGQRDALNALRWRFVLPLGGTEPTTEPEMTAVNATHYGMQTFERDAGAVPARTPVVQRFGYLRESIIPSFAHTIANEAMDAQGIAGLPAPFARLTDGVEDLPAEESVADTPAQEGRLLDNPLLWGAAAVAFLMGLLLVVDGARKGRATQQPGDTSV